MGGSFPTTNSSPPEICPCGYELQISGVTIKNSDPPDGGPEFLVTRRRFALAGINFESPGLPLKIPVRLTADRNFW
jgi:hypothetical protein